MNTIKATSENTPEAHHKKSLLGRLSVILNLFRYVIFCMAVYFLITFVTSHQEDFRFLLKIDRFFLLIGLFLILIHNLLYCYRFYVCLNVQTRISFLKCVQYVNMGSFLSRIVYQGNNVLKATLLKVYDNLNFKKYIALNVYYNSIEIIIFLIFTIIILQFYQFKHKILNCDVLHIIIFVLILIFLFFGSLFFLKKHSSRQQQKLVQDLNNIFNGILFFYSDSNLLLKNVFLVMIKFFLNSAIVYYLYKSAGIQLDLPSAVIYVTLVRISNIIQLLPSNLIITESIFGFISNSLGIESAIGVSVALAIRFLNILVEGILNITLSLSPIRSKKSTFQRIS